MGKKLIVREREVVDEGIYSAKFKNAEKKEGKFGDYYVFSFSVTSGKFKGKSVNGNCPAIVEIKSKTHKWISSILGKTIDVDDEIDLDDLAGKECKIAVEHNVTDDGTYAKVVAVHKYSDEEEEEEEKPKKKHVDDEEEEEKPKKKHVDDEEEEEKPKKKHVDDDDFN